MQAFAYVPVTTVEQAVTVLSNEGDAVRVLSGGTDLLVQMREGRRKVGTVLDIKGIPEMNELSLDLNGGLRIGAAVPCYRICAHPGIADHYPGLVDAISVIGGMQIQGRASLGGNLCNASPAADSIPALIVHGAIAIIAGPDGKRELAVDQFCLAPGVNALGRGELLVSLHIPTPPLHFGAAYLRFIPRHEMDIAVVGAGAAVVLDGAGTTFQSARVALGAVAPRPLSIVDIEQTLAGRMCTEEVIADAERVAQSAARPITDMRGSAAQRIHLSAVLTRRAIEKAIERARVN